MQKEKLLIMKKSLKVIAATAVLSLATFNLNTALAQTWTQRSESDVRETLKTSESGVYVIQWGDTLSTIAAATGYSVAELASINAIADVNFIQAGSVLYFNHQTNTLSYVNPTSEQPQTYNVVPATHYAVSETAEWVSETSTSSVDQNETTSAPVSEETVAPVEESVVTEAPTVEEPVSTEVPTVEETTQAPVMAETSTVETTVSEAPATPEVRAVEETTLAPVSEETTPVVEEPVTTEAPAVSEEVAPAPVATNSGLNEYGGIISEAKEWIAMKESGGNYEIWNPSGTYYGRYQLTVSYLKGDLSRENQEKVADEYVINRYGSWEAAKVFWEANGWY
ncbi:LysM peptidoglycan-binding domain-containing protein [Aerococcaceae bacterium zg-B36]|uniref:aggregation-promoting factor C-terminal-like domain-containing protein n=1 Tax=Aerococcaceae bacterium zg-252 TaxID=2796928 RepID=UPI001BD90093|nr:LysM peptidoglycan-binding domain-containing protein [Aerococcaceae bacterium zg-B36]